MEDPQDFEQEILQRIREIAPLPDALALDKVDELINELRDGVDWERFKARRALETRRAKAAHLEILLANDVPLDSWVDCRDFYERVQRLGLGWLPEIRDQFAGDIAEVRQFAEPIARAAAVTAARSVMEACLDEHITSTQIGARILRDVAGAGEYLLAIAPSEEHRALVRAVREHVARYQWAKRIREAEVADALVPTTKGKRLRAEALVLLKQDWALVFRGEMPPDEVSP